MSRRAARPAQHYSWHQCITAARKVVDGLDAVSTYEQIGAELGVSKQRAYWVTMLALGKLVLMVRARFGPVELHQ